AVLQAGLALWLLDLTIPGTLLFATGISVSGYMLKYYSAFTTKGAAGNKIALNIGSILSGAMVALAPDKTTSLSACIILMFISLGSFMKFFKRSRLDHFNTDKKHFDMKIFFTLRGLAWAIIGFVIGVKLISIVSILPQFAMLENNGKLPEWFGLM